VYAWAGELHTVEMAKPGGPAFLPRVAGPGHAGGGAPGLPSFLFTLDDADLPQRPSVAKGTGDCTPAHIVLQWERLQHTREVVDRAGSDLRTNRMDEDNEDHATRRCTQREIEQAIWNAEEAQPHRTITGRVIIRSRTDGGEAVTVVAALTRDGGVRPITAWEA
jgi:hypothetical protein